MYEPKIPSTTPQTQAKVECYSKTSNFGNSWNSQNSTRLSHIISFINPYHSQQNINSNMHPIDYPYILPTTHIYYNHHHWLPKIKVFNKQDLHFPFLITNPIQPMPRERKHNSKLACMFPISLNPSQNWSSFLSTHTQNSNLFLPSHSTRKQRRRKERKKIEPAIQSKFTQSNIQTRIGKETSFLIN